MLPEPRLAEPEAFPASRPEADARVAPSLAQRYRRVRQASLRIAAPLRPEDMVIQTASFASPTKWHLAHTTWFFERFLLAEYVPGYEPHHPRYEYLFNSYYNTVGPQHCRANRGVVSRPDVHEVMAYREAVDRRMLDWLDTLETTGDKGPGADEARHRLIVGLHHEQQHQELMVSDLKYTFATNPLLPVYQEPLTDAPTPAATLGPAAWIDHDGGLSEVGAEPSADRFTYDNESPRHRVYLEPFALADRPVSNGEFRRFLEDGGYDRHELWLSAGWAWRQAERIEHPLYWYRDPAAGEGWMQYTLHGPRPLDEAEPVCHLSYFEADAFARWADARLPTEFEWETAARGIDPPGADDPIPPFHPRPLTKLPETLGRPRGLYTGTWEWTSSSYAAYPGFKPAAGALGEYNGKFMCNQYVLRGGCVATPPGHTRPTYRNFYAASDRWAFTGLRLARTL